MKKYKFDNIYIIQYICFYTYVIKFAGILLEKYIKVQYLIVFIFYIVSIDRQGTAFQGGWVKSVFQGHAA